MEAPETKRSNNWLALLVATTDTMQINRTAMAAWSIRQHMPQMPIAVITSRPADRLWRTGIVNIVLAAGTDRTPAACLLRAMDRNIFRHAFYLDSFCRFRSDATRHIVRTIEAAESGIALPYPQPSPADADPRPDPRLIGLHNNDNARGFLNAWNAATEENEAGDTAAAPSQAPSQAFAQALARWDGTPGRLGADWVPTAHTAGPAETENLPNIEVRQGNANRLHSEMLLFALHRLVSGDLKQAAVAYARVALETRPDLPQLGAARLLPYLAEAFRRRLPGLDERGRASLKRLLLQAAEEDPAGNLMGIAALHLEMGQARTALAVLKMIQRMKFKQPVPAP